jgi:hypothetical protein
MHLRWQPVILERSSVHAVCFKRSDRLHFDLIIVSVFTRTTSLALVGKFHLSQVFYRGSQLVPLVMTGLGPVDVYGPL